MPLQFTSTSWQMCKLFSGPPLTSFYLWASGPSACDCRLLTASPNYRDCQAYLWRCEVHWWPDHFKGRAPCERRSSVWKAAAVGVPQPFSQIQGSVPTRKSSNHTAAVANFWEFLECGFSSIFATELIVIQGLSHCMYRVRTLLPSSQHLSKWLTRSM